MTEQPVRPADVDRRRKGWVAVATIVFAFLLIVLALMVATSPGSVPAPSGGTSSISVVDCPSLAAVARSGVPEAMPYTCTNIIVGRFVATASLAIGMTLIASFGALGIAWRVGRR